MYDPSFLQELLRLQHGGMPFCTVTIVDARGSIPQEIGAKAVFGPDGLIFGTVGGGRIEAHCAQQAAALLAGDGAPPTRFERVNLNRDLAMTCAGEVAVYYEVDRPELAWSIVVFGAGHVAQKLCRMLIELDCRVTCIDTRPDWLERLPNSPKLDRRLVAEYAEGVDAVTAGAMVVVMTMGHVTDMPVLHALHHRGPRPSYLGVIGSDSKAHALRRQLREDGLPQAFIDAIVCPIGEKLGNNTPPEIAVSVLAQLVRHHRDGEAPEQR